MNEEPYSLLALANIIRVIAITLAIYDLTQIVSIYSLFRRRLALDKDSRLVTAHAQAVNTHILPTSIGVVGLVLFAVIELFQLLGSPLTWKGIYLIFVFGLLAHSLHKFCQAQLIMLAEAIHWNKKTKTQTGEQ